MGSSERGLCGAIWATVYAAGSGYVDSSEGVVSDDKGLSFHPVFPRDQAIASSL
jgi:hypothetical protein